MKQVAHYLKITKEDKIKLQIILKEINDSSCNCFSFKDKSYLEKTREDIEVIISEFNLICDKLLQNINSPTIENFSNNSPKTREETLVSHQQRTRYRVFNFISKLFGTQSGRISPGG